MTPEDHRRTQAFIRTKTRRSGLGGMAPTTFATGYLYAGMGFTTVNEAAVPVLSARHTHEEMSDIPIVDKSCLVLMANNEIMLDLLGTEHPNLASPRRRLGEVYAHLGRPAEAEGFYRSALRVVRDILHSTRRLHVRGPMWWARLRDPSRSRDGKLRRAG